MTPKASMAMLVLCSVAVGATIVIGQCAVPSRCSTRDSARKVPQEQQFQYASNWSSPVDIEGVHSVTTVKIGGGAAEQEPNRFASDDELYREAVSQARAGKLPATRPGRDPIAVALTAAAPGVIARLRVDLLRADVSQRETYIRVLSCVETDESVDLALEELPNCQGRAERLAILRLFAWQLFGPNARRDVRLATGALREADDETVRVYAEYVFRGSGEE